MRKRSLTQEKAIAVADWLRSKQQWIEEGGMDSPEIAAIVSKDFGFPIADSTVLRLGQSVGIRFRRATMTRKERVLLLAQALGDLFDRLGEARPESLVLALNGTHKDQ